MDKKITLWPYLTIGFFALGWLVAIPFIKAKKPLIGLAFVFAYLLPKVYVLATHPNNYGFFYNLGSALAWGTWSGPTAEFYPIPALVFGLVFTLVCWLTASATIEVVK